MRCLPALLLALGLAAPADAASRNFGITGFEKIRVEGPFQVRLRTGRPPFARASGSLAALEGVSVAVEGKTLVVRANRSGWGGGYPGRDPGPLEMDLGTHELSSASLSGSGSLTIDRVKGLSFAVSVHGSGSMAIDQADVDQLSVSVGGSGIAALRGQAGKVTALVRGQSSLDGTGLTAKTARLTAQGPATINVGVRDEATIAASGVATVALTGNPACTANLAGSASVSGCRTIQ